MRKNSNLAVSLILDERNGINRLNEPVTVGIPFPKGKIFSPAGLALCKPNGRRIPLQTQVLGSWFDGSAKWVLLDFLASLDAYTQTSYELRTNVDAEVDFEAPKLSFVETAGQVIVDTGDTQFYLNRRICKPFDRIVTNNADLLAPEGSYFLVVDDAGREYTPCIQGLTPEATGPLRVTFRASGEFKSESRRIFGRFVARMIFHAGSEFVETKITIHNPRAARHPGGLWDLGDEGSVYFKDFSLYLPVREQSRIEQPITWTTRLFQKGGMRSSHSVEIYQGSSGGINWRSTNHVNRFGKVIHSFRGYRVKADDILMEHGLRAIPIIGMKTKNGGVVGAIDKFWQNFPKAIEADNQRMILRLFPRNYNDVFELQGGEQKTHTLYLQFCGGGKQPCSLSWVHDRLIPRAAPEWYSESKACSYVSPRSEDKRTDCQQLIESAIDGPRSFFARREIIDEYGWRSFGDLYADHEAIGHKGDVPLVAHYNNQYDVVYGALIQYLRNGDRRWFDLASDLARHVIDIDIYHTDEDRPAYNGGLFWHTDHYLDAGTATHRTYSKSNLCEKMPGAYGGGPCNEHNYTTGLLHYYYLTGDETAREAVLSLADWVINMDSGAYGMLGFIDRRPTGMASSTTSRGYHGPGRGAGNSVNALLDAHSLTWDSRYLDKAEELVRRCVHPMDEIGRRKLDDPEHRWSYLVFLQTLGKYLDHKAQQGSCDLMYAYAQASLLHYAEWMLHHEVPYSTVLHKVEIPTETWPAQDIRKSVVFYLAAKHATGSIRNKFREKASFFFQTCIYDLLSFPTYTLTRPIILLLTNAHVHPYFQQYPEERAPRPRKRYGFGQPQEFSPQCAELYRVREKLSALVPHLLDYRRQITTFFTGLCARSLLLSSRERPNNLK